MQIILASQSPRRKQLLEWAEIDFTVLVSHAVETYPSGMAVAEIPIHIARQKALAVKSMVDERAIIVAADTVVVLDGEVIGKPVDAEDAERILSLLSGRKHEVITGVVIMQGEKETAFAEITEVKFHALSGQQIKYYINHYKPFDKAGAYAIQEWIGVIGIESIRGDFYNVMGLPVSRVVQCLNMLAQGAE